MHDFRTLLLFSIQSSNFEGTMLFFGTTRSFARLSHCLLENNVGDKSSDDDKKKIIRNLSV